MQPFEVVIPHVGSDIFFHLISGWLMDFEKPVVFQAAKEPFDNGVIPTCANIAHTGSHIITRQ
jgi:hypothetical protein